MIGDVAAAGRLLVASDFDGTLSHLVDRPEDARLHPGAGDALRRLTVLPDTWVAVVSGRPRRFLTDVFGESDLILVGEHGADWGDAAPPDSDELREARRQVGALADRLPGALAEQKQRSVSLHYRLVKRPVDDEVDKLRRWGKARGLRTLDGKQVLELTVASVDKGEAVEALRRRLGVDAVVFLGDDATDETVFTRLRPSDLGVHVGTGPTAARATLAGVDDVPGFLDDIATARQVR